MLTAGMRFGFAFPDFQPLNIRGAQRRLKKTALWMKRRRAVHPHRPSGTPWVRVHRQHWPQSYLTNLINRRRP